MLTERIIRDAKPEPVQRVLWDSQIKGLGVRVEELSNVVDRP